MKEARRWSPTLLIIEDDPGIRDSLALGLQFEGYRVLASATASDGLSLLKKHPIDALILDILLPGADGYSVLAELRQPSSAFCQLPILVLSALDDVEDRVRGLLRGADDYLVKPFALSELVARIETLLRRTGRKSQTLNYGPLCLYPERLTATRDGRLLSLAPKEYLLLQALVMHAERIMSKRALMQLIWQEPVDPNLLEVLVSGLRRALGDPPLIRTVRGYGYVLEAR